MNTQQLRLYSSLLAKDIVAKDTGNLARSIISIERPNGYSIIQKSFGALYGEIINDGRTDRPLSSKERANVGWWSERVYDGIVNLIATNQNGIKTQYQEIARQLQPTPARQQAFLRSAARSVR